MREKSKRQKYVTLPLISFVVNEIKYMYISSCFHSIIRICTYVRQGQNVLTGRTNKLKSWSMLHWDKRDNFMDDLWHGYLFPCYWAFVRGIADHWCIPLTKGHWWLAFMFFLLPTWTSCWTKSPVVDAMTLIMIEIPRHGDAIKWKHFPRY